MLFKLKKLKTGAIAVIAMLSAIPMQGQDLLARQAPIDKKMRSVDSVALQKLINTDNLQNPAFDLYHGWHNNYVSRYNVEMPQEYKIDLRHFCMPTPSRLVTSNYGYRRTFGRMHKGLDIKVYIGDTIRAAFSGKVRIVAYERGGYGKYIVIRHPNGLETVYGHLSKQIVKEDQVVQAGEPIGLGGNTGRSTGSHLHFETRFLGQAINPAEMFDFVEQDVTGDYYLFRANGKGYVLNGNERVPADLASITPATASEKKKPAKKENPIRIHKVKSGENLSTIAKKLGTTIEKLCKMNGLSRKATLRPGQILRYS